MERAALANDPAHTAAASAFATAQADQSAALAVFEKSLPTLSGVAPADETLAMAQTLAQSDIDAAQRNLEQALSNDKKS